MVPESTIRVALANYVVNQLDHFRGVFTSLALLQAAYPTATAGDYATVDPGAGFTILQYIWDSNEGWVSRDSGALNLETFNTTLTFGYDKDYATVTGGTRTFTIASSGNVNGVAILARVNKPVAVNFPAGSEALEGSSTVSTTSMNIILFRYFSNYDGAGNDKVLYQVRLQTGV